MDLKIVNDAFFSVFTKVVKRERTTVIITESKIRRCHDVMDVVVNNDHHKLHYGVFFTEKSESTKE